MKPRDYGRRSRRFQVATRPKAARRNRAAQAVALSMLLLGAMAVLTFQHFRPTLAAAWARLSVPADVRLEGVPAELESKVRAAIQSMKVEAASQAEPLLKAFPAFRSVRVTRSWLRGRTIYAFELQKPAARLTDGRCLGESGAVFHSPDNACAELSTIVEIAGAGLQDLKNLGGALAQAGGEGSSAELARMSFISSAEGWKAVLKDGTEVRWGGLSWTQEKLQRLGQALEDARAADRALARGSAASEGRSDAAQPGPFAADLRYFEDGKIILRRVR